MKAAIKAMAIRLLLSIIIYTLLTKQKLKAGFPWKEEIPTN